MYIIISVSVSRYDRGDMAAKGVSGGEGLMLRFWSPKSSKFVLWSPRSVIRRPDFICNSKLKLSSLYIILYYIPQCVFYWILSCHQPTRLTQDHPPTISGTADADANVVKCVLTWIVQKNIKLLYWKAVGREKKSTPVGCIE